MSKGEHIQPSFVAPIPGAEMFERGRRREEALVSKRKVTDAIAAAVVRQETRNARERWAPYLPLVYKDFHSVTGNEVFTAFLGTTAWPEIYTRVRSKIDTFENEEKMRLATIAPVFASMGSGMVASAALRYGDLFIPRDEMERMQHTLYPPTSEDPEKTQPKKYIPDGIVLNKDGDISRIVECRISERGLDKYRDGYDRLSEILSDGQEAQPNWLIVTTLLSHERHDALKEQDSISHYQLPFTSGAFRSFANRLLASPHGSEDGLSLTEVFRNR